MPALILIYTLMDTFAWAVYRHEKSSRKRFEELTRQWILPNSKLRCEPPDLYAARCGILHTMTSEASLILDGKARKIAYAWGKANAEKLTSTLSVLGRDDVIALHVEDLFSAVREGIACAMEKAEVDSQLKSNLEEAASKHFANMESETVDAFLSKVNREAGS